MSAVMHPVAVATSLPASVHTSAAGTIATKRTGLVDVRAGLIVSEAAAAASILAVQSSLPPPAQLSAGRLVLVAVRIGVTAGRGAWVR